ncbi:hypothetical protein [Actinomadura opuntiae]|uniref:hypothetical protein n=1 Tax=Actinomadura sp. OS1-43 TaxID=604315 RepID=UPI00255AF17B|nr:hypothetical protein [Actinomadura sp. OS1-43]MDL4820450.1 hypothetical protein [Actinomadura sp. OS1-43]
MTEDPDEPLEGDIGPAAGAVRPAGPETDPAEDMRRYAAEREERRRRTNALSGRVAAVLCAALLAYLTYDAVRAAIDHHAHGRNWIYPPGVVAAACAVTLAALLTWAVRRVK